VRSNIVENTDGSNDGGGHDNLGVFAFTEQNLKQLAYTKLKTADLFGCA